MDAQRRELARVRDRLDESVLAFCRTHARFVLADLAAAVQGPGAPDSPSRILRALRQAGAVHYRVVDRRASLYEVTYVRGGDGRLFA